jgi:hypothetical protein
MTGDAFTPRGKVSGREACLVVFRAMAPGEWVEVSDLTYQVSQLTGEEWTVDAVKSAAWQARETLARNAEVGAEWHMGGYKRLDVAGQVSAASKRLKKVRRAAHRTVSWAGAALANPAVTGAERHQMQQIQALRVAQDALDERRAGRRRPIEAPPD